MLLILPMLLWIAGCLPQPPSGAESTATPTATGTLSPTVTNTIQWFPATATFTPYPTREQAATAIMNPGIGTILYEDDFSDSLLWPTARNESGSVAYGKNELTLAVTAAKGQLSSLLPKQIFTDFYYEVDANPSLCRGGDAYGLFFRANSPREGYRLLVNCKGQVRVEREKDYTVVPLQDWASSGQVLPDMLIKTHLGVWVAGSEIRIFINDIYQFSVRDPAFSQGQIGVLARAAADTPLTVSFSSLSISQVDPNRVPTPVPTPTITVQPTATRRPTATSQP